jgi:predicted GH43/DUF377 family glycosyl hydrolase
VVSPCGSIVRGKKLYVYYGGADRVTGVAAADLDALVEHVRAASVTGSA